MSDPDIFALLEQREAELEARDKARLAVDSVELYRLKVELGDNSVCSVRVPFIDDDTPVLLIGRCVNKVELKRYRDTTANNKLKAFDAAVAVAACTLLYPSKETVAAIEERRPGVIGQLGVACVELGVGEAEHRAKK